MMFLIEKGGGMQYTIMNIYSGLLYGTKLLRIKFPTARYMWNNELKLFSLYFCKGYEEEVMTPSVREVQYGYKYYFSVLMSHCC